LTNITPCGIYSSMKGYKLYVLGAVVATVAFVGSVTSIVYDRVSSSKAPVETQVASQSIQQPKPVTLNKQHIYELINAERANAGLAPLATNTLLENSACAKAQHMIDNNYWGHVAPDGTQPWYFFDQAGYAYSRAGENLAYGHNTEESVISVWMNSPTHKENILGDYQEDGLCVLNNITYQGYVGTNLIVHHFGTLR